METHLSNDTLHIRNRAVSGQVSFDPLTLFQRSKTWLAFVGSGFHWNRAGMGLLLCGAALLGGVRNLSGAEKMKAVVLLPGGVPGECEYVTLQKFKLNGKSEVRVLERHSGLDGPEASVLKDVYKKADKVRLEAVTRIVLERGVPRLYLSGDKALIALPDGFDFGKAQSAKLIELAGRLLEGEGRDETPKGKKAISLSAIWKVYFVTESAPLEEVAYRHCREEDRVEVWRAYFKSFSASQRANEAHQHFHVRLLATAREAFGKFSSGSYPELGRARELLREAEGVLPGNPLNRDFQVQLDKAEKDLQSAIEVASNMLENKAFDEAIDRLSPFTKYATDVLPLRDVYLKSLQGSNREHRQKGAELMKANRLEEALKEYETAAGRLPQDPETRSELSEAHIRIGLRDTQALLDRKDYKSALDKGEQLTKEYPSDSRLSELIRKVKGARGQELHQQARQLLNLPAPAKPPGKGPVGRIVRPATKPAPVSITTREAESRHLEALNLLQEANRLAPNDQGLQDLQVAQRRLSDYYLALSKRAAARPRGSGLGSSYLFLERAQFYDPTRDDLAEPLLQARESFLKKATLPVAIRIRSKARTNDSTSFADQMEAGISSALVNARLPGVSVVERDALPELQSELELMKKLSSDEAVPNLQRAVALVVADVLVNSCRSRNLTIQRRSRYIANEWENQKWHEYENQSDYWDSQWDACRKQLGNNHPTCQGYRTQKEYFARMRDGVPRILQDIRPYTYNERQASVEASVKVSYRFVDSLTSERMMQQFIEKADTGSGVEILDAMPRDLQNIVNRPLSIPDESQLLGSLQQQVQQELVQKTLEYCRGLAAKFYERAEAAAAAGNFDEALEQYALFLFSTPRKDSIEAGKAATFLRTKFSLEFDGNLP
ncbi:MAG: hypothetical protein AB1898_25385 [Acidobacteriota bacterium]